MAILTMLTDFGTSDYYVAAMKGVVYSRCPDLKVVDVSHDVPPGAISTASFLLAAAAPEFPAGTVHLAVVDPGVGTGRRILALRTEKDRRFIAPDNGLLEPFLDLPGIVVRDVRRADLHRENGSRTFHGRDRFAPIAVAWAGGEPFEELGPVIDDPVRAETSPPHRFEGARRAPSVEGSVVHVDRFGNLVTNIPASWLPGSRLSGVPDDEGPDDDMPVDDMPVDDMPVDESPVDARIAKHRVSRWADCYDRIPRGEPALLVGSLDTVEVSLRGESLAAAWGIELGTRVTIAVDPEECRTRDSGDLDDPRPGRAGNVPARLSESTGEGKERAMTRWEYKIINIRSEQYRLDPEAYPKLNELGAEGWELVGLTSVNFKTGATDNIAMVFKRPLE